MFVKLVLATNAAPTEAVAMLAVGRTKRSLFELITRVLCLSWHSAIPLTKAQVGKQL